MKEVYSKSAQIIEKISIKSRFILLKKVQAVVQKTSRKNLMPTINFIVAPCIS